ncbi:MAG: lysophospholipid acyltransferase family protein [Pelovirga sp.]
MKPITLKQRLEYVALRVLAPLVRVLPRSLALRCGRTTGWLAGRVLHERRRLAQQNVALALPELTPEQVSDLVSRNFVQLGMSAVEALRLDLLDPENLTQYFELEGLERLEEALALQRGVILLTAHLGFWEAGHFVFPALGIPLDTITKPLKNRLVDGYFQQIRSHFGARTLNSRKGARRILKALQQGRAVGLLLDQHISPPGAVAVDFFGRKAFTTTAITSMAMKHQIPVVPTFCLRLPDNRYHVWVEPMLLLGNDDPDALTVNTQLLTDVIEAAVRRDASQWFWMHRRWRGARKKKKSHNQTVVKRKTEK